MKHRSIRFKIGMVFGQILFSALLLAGAGFYAVELYKNQVRNVAWRADVLPVADSLNIHIGEVKAALGELQIIRRSQFRLAPTDINKDRFLLESRFKKALFDVRRAHSKYRQEIENRIAQGRHEKSFRKEFSILHDIRTSLQELDEQVASNDWSLTEGRLEAIEKDLDELQKQVAALPKHLHDELRGYTESMKRRARWLNGIMLLCITISALLTGLLIWLSYVWIFRPLNILIRDSRQIAAGDFEHRIALSSKDEITDLAEAMNHMTQRFEEIRRDLDEKVQQRSRELIRSERLASVGFLAAGVAHEINNPLASISTCAESLQRRLIPTLEQNPDAEKETEYARRYLRMIEEEAFRCKDITEKLLSFARSERKERELVDLVPLISDIVDMTRQHEAFRQKDIKVDMPQTLYATVNPQEVKQIVLNLLSNALSCTEQNGKVALRLRQENKRKKDYAVLTVSDNGCGMDAETLKNIFEPFFTRREHGQGTGLGLSITHRIVEEHQGRIEAHSSGLDKGSSFVIELPIAETR